MENNEPKQPQGKTYDGGVTEEQINKWKAAHKRVVRINVTDGDDLHVAYFKRPSLETMSAVTKVPRYFTTTVFWAATPKYAKMRCCSWRRRRSSDSCSTRASVV